MNTDQKGNAKFTIRTSSLADIDANTLAAWQELESRSLEANAFLSPHFVIPEIKYLGNASKVFFLFVEKISENSTVLVGVAIFQKVKFSKHFPLPHLRALDSKHSFLSGFLIDRDCAAETIKAIFEYLSKPNGKWNAVVFKNKSAGTPFSNLANEAAQAFGIKWSQFRQWERAALFPVGISESSQNAISKNVKKTIRRRMRRLQEAGNVQWKILHNDTLTPESVETLLKLENLGWKGNKGSSIKSNPSEEMFFVEMSNNFRNVGRVFINELSLNNNAISSAIKLISGNTAFAFKIGWDPEYYKFSPGYLNESQWLETTEGLPSQVEIFDSDASEDAIYMNELWQQRRSLETGAYVVTNLGKLFLPIVLLASKIKSANR